MIRKTAVILMVLLFASPAWAGLTGLGIGVHGGMISGYKNSALENNILSNYANFSLSDQMTDLGAHLKVGTFRIIEFDLSADFAWKKQRVNSGLNVTYSDFSVSASARKPFSFGLLKPYVGVGAGIHRLIYSIELDDQIVGVVLPENESKLGYHVKAGVDLAVPLFPFTPFAEWKYTSVQTSGKDVRYSAVLAGITMDLF